MEIPKDDVFAFCIMLLRSGLSLECDSFNDVLFADYFNVVYNINQGRVWVLKEV